MKALLIGGPEDGRVIEDAKFRGTYYDVKGHRYYLVFTIISVDMIVLTHKNSWEPDKIMATLALHYADTKRGRVGTVACHHNWFAVQNLEDVKAKFVCSVCGAQR